MTRTFRHEFDPPQEDPIAGQDDVELTVQQIEDAGLLEVLQTPGAALGSWALLDALLEPTGDGTPFVFRRPLGEAREVKVALSGLFGRFVACADSVSDERQGHEIARVDGLLNEAEEIPVEGFQETNGLIGGIVTRGGPVPAPILRAQTGRCSRVSICVRSLSASNATSCMPWPLAIPQPSGEHSPLCRRLRRGARRGNRASGWIIPLEG